MAFKLEKEFQKLIHDNPDIILNGIPEINPELCGDNTPKIVSLGTEINSTDNIFIDTNGILTIVECKLYSNTELDRKVYPQIINYASGLQDVLKNYTESEEFLEEFFKLIDNGDNKYENIDELIEELSTEPILLGKDKDKWKKQFKEYLRKNIKSGIFRLIIVCVPHLKCNEKDKVVNFNQKDIKNLIQIVNFSESKSNKYELIIMDSRLKDGSKKPDTITKDDMVSRIIWRNYKSLREVPLISDTLRTNITKESYYEELEIAKGADIVKKVDKIFNNFEDNKGKIIVWAKLPIIRYKTKYKGNNLEFNLGQINKNGKYVGTDRLRDRFRGRQDKKDPRWGKIDIDDWHKINDKYFEELQEIFPGSKYRKSPTGSKNFYAGEDGFNYPEIEKINVDEFKKTIDNFIKIIDKFLQDSN